MYAQKSCFPTYRLRVSVVACNILNYCTLLADTQCVGCWSSRVNPHRYPEAGVSVVNTHVYCKLQLTTDTRNLKRRNIYFLEFSYTSCAELCNKSNGRLRQFYQTASLKKKLLSDFSVILYRVLFW